MNVNQFVILRVGKREKRNKQSSLTSNFEAYSVSYYLSFKGIPEKCSGLRMLDTMST